MQRRDELETRGYDPETINRKTESFRKKRINELMEQQDLEGGKTTKYSSKDDKDKDRKSSKDKHEGSEKKKPKKSRSRSRFLLSHFYIHPLTTRQWIWRNLSNDLAKANVAKAYFTAESIIIVTSRINK